MKINDLFIPFTEILNWSVIDKIEVINKLKECEQNPKWHSEGNAYKHTIKCLEHANKLLKENIDKYSLEDKRLLLTAVLFHDIGKTTTTELGKDNCWHSYGHETVGERMFRILFWDEDVTTREKICALIRYHMDVLRLYKNKTFLNDIVRLSYNVNLKHLLFLKECDVYGSVSSDKHTKDCDITNLLYLNIIADDIEDYQYLLPFKKLFCRKKEIFSYEYKEPTQTVTVLIGLPGAGKDTYIKDKLDENTVSVCRDDIRIELGYCKEGEKYLGSQEQEENVTTVFNKKLVDAVHSGKNVIINNTNLRRKYRDGYKTILCLDNVSWDYVYIEAPTLEDNYKRREGQIDSSIIRRMADNIDWPTAEEYDHLLILKQNC